MPVLLFSAHAVFAAEELRLAYERQSLTATWRTYHQYIDGVEVIGTAVIERVDADGSVHEVTREVARAAPPRKLLAMTQALASLPAGEVTERTLVNVNVNGEARPAWRVVVKEKPLEPVAHYVDAATGAELRREPLFWTAKGRVFDPNPVAKMNDPSLRDQNNVAGAVPDAAYVTVDLPDLPTAGPLVGPNVAIVDAEQPFTAHADAGQSLIFDRSQPQFEEVNAYFHIDRAQRYLQSLGYRGARQVVAYAIPVDPHAASGTDNSYYISDGNGKGTLYFGDGGTDDAEDSDIMLHEFGHAIQDWIAPGAFGGPPSAQARAVGEGFGDYWSFSSSYLQTGATGRDPFCIADWDARCFGDDPSQNCSYPSGADCLRRVDSPKTMANYLEADTPGTEHQNGMIWSSALREIFMNLVAQSGADTGRRITDADVIEGTFGIPPNPTFAGMARKLLDADRALWGGSHLSTICAAMTKRGILAGSDCGVMPRGELTIVQGSEHGIPIPDNGTAITSTLTVLDTRPIDRLQVRVDIEHPQRGDLQIALVAPDGTSLFLQQPSNDRVPDVHATFGFDTEPAEPLDRFVTHSIAGQWKLLVSDTHPGGAGRLLSWALVIKFHGDEPRTLRPFSFAPRQHIAAVARTGGIDGSQWRSDLFLYNRGTAPATVTIVYTPLAANGISNFGAVNAVVPPKQVVAFRNVVGQLFSASGGGTLELQADVQHIAAWSATYDASGSGTVGQSIEAVRSTDAAGANDPSLWIDALSDAGAARSNIGVVETAGESGSATVTVYDQVTRVPLVRQSIDLVPFTHVQFPMPVLRDAAAKFAEVKVTDGNARVIAYGSVVGTASRDAMYVPARRVTARFQGIIPAAAATVGANGTSWTTNLWIDNVLPVAEQVFTPQIPILYYDATGTSRGMTRSGIGSSYTANFVSTLTTAANSTGQIDIALPPGVLATSFLGSNSGRGDTILPIPASEATGNGDAVDAIRVENDAAFRTNFGVTEVAGAPALLRITLYDAAGNVLGSTLGFVPARGRMQLAVSALSAAPLVDGRLHFEVIGGGGRVFAYASVVDNLSADAYFVRAR